MLRTLLALTLAMIYSTVAAGQQPNPQCPTIRVIGPPGIPMEGEPFPFTVKVKPAESKLSFKWRISYGVISSGQGTSTIHVKIGPNDAGTTATVEISGLPKECPNFASEGVDWGDRLLHPEKLDAFELPLSSIKDEQFRSIVDAIKNNPTSQIYILVPGVKEVRDELIERLKKVVNPSIDLSELIIG